MPEGQFGLKTHSILFSKNWNFDVAQKRSAFFCAFSSMLLKFQNSFTLCFKYLVNILANY